MLLLVAQSKFYQWNREFRLPSKKVFLPIRQGVTAYAALCYLAAAIINCLSVKTLNDLIVYLCNIIQFVR